MRNQAQIKAAITSLRNNRDNAGQAKRPLHKLALTLTISTLALWATDAWAKTDAAWNFTHAAPERQGAGSGRRYTR